MAKTGPQATKSEPPNTFGGCMKTRRLARHFLTGAGPLFRALLMLILCGGLNLYGQQITGSIAGTVKDAQGAVVTSATVKATNVETGLSRSTTAPTGRTSSSIFPSAHTPLKWMHRLQEVCAAECRTDRRPDANAERTLAVGMQSQTVTVTEAPPLVDTNSAELGRTVQPAEIIGLPLVNRNAYAELSLTPGVQSNSASPISNTQRHSQFCHWRARPPRSWSMAASTAAFPWSAFTWMAAST